MAEVATTCCMNMRCTLAKMNDERSTPVFDSSVLCIKYFVSTKCCITSSCYLAASNIHIPRHPRLPFNIRVDKRQIRRNLRGWPNPKFLPSFKQPYIFPNKNESFLPSKFDMQNSDMF